MRIAYNPKSVEPLKVAPTGDYLNAITFDLAGHNIFARGEMFKGTDTTYDVFKKATSTAVGYNGLVPAPSYSDLAIRFLREDGTWQFLQSNSQRPIDVDNNNVLLSTDIDKSLNLVAGNNIVLEPQTDSNGKFTGEVIINTTFEISGEFDGTLADAFTTVKVGAALLKASNNKLLTLNAGTGITLTPNTTSNTILIDAPIFTGATTSTAGKEGIIPAPTTDNIISYLRGDGNWANLTTDLVIGLTDYVYNYTLATTPSNLATSDTLNEALAKLEHKANQGVSAYNWVISVTTEDTDQYINKWQEIVDFLNKVNNTDGTDITDEFVTRKTAQTITGAKTFEAATVISNTLAVAGATTINNTLTVGGNILPKTTNTYNLGSQTGVWNYVYSNTFIGNLNGNLIGGSKGNIVYQSNVNTTSFLENPTEDGVLSFDTATNTIVWKNEIGGANKIRITSNNDNEVFPVIFIDSSFCGSTKNKKADLYVDTIAGSGYNPSIDAFVAKLFIADGFVKNSSSDSYVLLGGGGHKQISDFMLKSEELTNNVVSFLNKSLNVTQAWIDTGISGSDLATGTYIVQVTVNGGNMSECIWSGTMSWYSGTCSSIETDEILLHRSGKSYSNTIYLRTLMQSSGVLKLLIAADENLSASYSYSFKFKQVL